MEKPCGAIATHGPKVDPSLGVINIFFFLTKIYLGFFYYAIHVYYEIILSIQF
ncbi:transmembrane protein, putative [Medicago truncatula]|uniref:Transmembrane protein, putative n=1 Tax=Medicago truncatula TaxID=3880 RepID=G7KDB4_MEDTR|nr:transmembrane protein, putative [Medicago truncatula]